MQEAAKFRLPVMHNSIYDSRIHNSVPLESVIPMQKLEKTKKDSATSDLHLRPIFDIKICSKEWKWYNWNVILFFLSLISRTLCNTVSLLIASCPSSRTSCDEPIIRGFSKRKRLSKPDKTFNNQALQWNIFCNPGNPNFLCSFISGICAKW